MLLYLAVLHQQQPRCQFQLRVEPLDDKSAINDHGDAFIDFCAGSAATPVDAPSLAASLQSMPLRSERS